jgi:hypothetical protein
MTINGKFLNASCKEINVIKTLFKEIRSNFDSIFFIKVINDDEFVLFVFE